MSPTDPPTSQKNSHPWLAVLAILIASISALIIASVLLHLVSDALAPLMLAIMALEIIVVFCRDETPLLQRQLKASCLLLLAQSDKYRLIQTLIRNPPSGQPAL